MKLVRNLFLTARFFYGAGALIALMTLSYPFPFLLPFAKTGCIIFPIVVVIDILLVFNRNVSIQVKRKTPSVLSLGDANEIKLTLFSRSGMKLAAEIIDELPEQFQVRN